MTTREQILKAIEIYKNGQYETVTFCEILGGLYYFEPSGYRYFFGEERKLLDELVFLTERYSSFPEEVACYGYFSEDQVKTKFDEVIAKLNW